MLGLRTMVVSTRLTPVEGTFLKTLACQEGCSVSQTVRRILKRAMRIRLHEEFGVALTPGPELPSPTLPGHDV